MLKCTTLFQKYYNMECVGQSSKKLSWAHVLGNAVVKGTFGKKSFDLQVHTLQAVVLMEFNAKATGEASSSAGAIVGGGSGSKAFPALLEALQIPEESLKRVLHSLSCGKYKVITIILD
jgi:cullin 1